MTCDLFLFSPSHILRNAISSGHVVTRLQIQTCSPFFHARLTPGLRKSNRPGPVTELRPCVEHPRLGGAKTARHLARASALGPVPIGASGDPGDDHNGTQPVGSCRGRTWTTARAIGSDSGPRSNRGPSRPRRMTRRPLHSSQVLITTPKKWPNQHTPPSSSSAPAPPASAPPSGSPASASPLSSSSAAPARSRSARPTACRRAPSRSLTVLGWPRTCSARRTTCWRLRFGPGKRRRASPGRGTRRIWRRGLVTSRMSF